MRQHPTTCSPSCPRKRLQGPSRRLAELRSASSPHGRWAGAAQSCRGRRCPGSQASGRRRAAARAAEGQGTPEKVQPGLRQTDPNPQQQLTLSGEQAAAAEEERGPGRVGRGAAGPSSSSRVRGSLSASFLPSCTSGWFRIGWKEEVQERGEALCVVCGRKRSSGKPPFPLRGKTMLAARHPPAAIRAAPPSTWEVAARLKGWKGRGQAASWRWPSCSGQRTTRAHPRAGTPLLGRPLRTLQKAQPTCCPENPGGCWERKKSLLPTPPPRSCSAGLIPQPSPPKMEPGAGQRWEWVSLPRAHPNSPLRPTWSSLQPHLWEAREGTPPAAGELCSPQDGARPVPQTLDTTKERDR